MKFVKFVKGPNQGHFGVIVKELGPTSQVQVMTRWEGPSHRQIHPMATEPSFNFEIVGEDEYKAAMLS